MYNLVAKLIRKTERLIFLILIEGVAGYYAYRSIERRIKELEMKEV